MSITFGRSLLLTKLHRRLGPLVLECSDEESSSSKRSLLGERLTLEATSSSEEIDIGCCCFFMLYCLLLLVVVNLIKLDEELGKKKQVIKSDGAVHNC